MWEVGNYKNLLKLIKNDEQIIQDCKKNIEVWQEFLLSQGRPAGYKSSTSYNDYDCIHGTRVDIPLDRIVENIRRNEHMIELAEMEKNNLENMRKRIEEKLSQLHGIEGIIYKKKVVEGRSVKQIWCELEKEGLNYSFSYIEKLSAKVGKV